MNYKALFQIAMSLISSPAKAWEEIRLEDRRAVLTVFVYPMIGLCGLSVFIGALWTTLQTITCQYGFTTEGARRERKFNSALGGGGSFVRRLFSGGLCYQSDGDKNVWYDQ